MISRLAAAQVFSLSVISTLGARPCFLRSLRNSRLAAYLSRRLWTRTSRTKPSWSTARQSQCFFPAKLTTTSSRCHLSPRRGARRRIRLANSRPNFKPAKLVDWDVAIGDRYLATPTYADSVVAQLDGAVWRPSRARHRVLLADREML